MQISQCLHTAILVSDLAIAENFYSQILGLPKVNRHLKYPGAWYQVGNFQIHLIVDSNERSPLQNPEKWGRNPHIALGVTDLEAAKHQLIADNYPIQSSASGRAAIFTQDPDGNIIELSQLEHFAAIP
jgi:catechol 2,3-dioxygenase-like lactoylglutathione lyase family enzyme